MEGLSHVSDMNPVIFNTTPVSRALLRTGEGWTYAADRNQLAHTVWQQLGLKLLSEIHTAFLLCLLGRSPWRQAPPAQLSYKLGRPRKSWSLTGCGSAALKASL
ncbi:hypothetical protein LEMLEM_LOCUS3743 [Lemmus lemmus]